MEGVERYKVNLIPHNAAWEEEYKQVKTELAQCWNTNIIDIQHIGSTAINAICAKPILDVAVKLQSIHKMDIGALERLGYEYCGARSGNKNYHLFVLRGEKQISLRHIHCYDKTEREFDLLVGFRDYLNTHINIAKEYEHIKTELAQKYPDDRVAYTAGKAGFIHSIYDRIEMQSIMGRFSD